MHGLPLQSLKKTQTPNQNTTTHRSLSQHRQAPPQHCQARLLLSFVILPEHRVLLCAHAHGLKPTPLSSTNRAPGSSPSTFNPTPNMLGSSRAGKFPGVPSSVNHAPHLNLLCKPFQVHWDASIRWTHPSGEDPAPNSSVGLSRTIPAPCPVPAVSSRAYISSSASPCSPPRCIYTEQSAPLPACPLLD